MFTVMVLALEPELLSEPEPELVPEPELEPPQAASTDATIRTAMINATILFIVFLLNKNNMIFDQTPTKRFNALTASDPAALYRRSAARPSLMVSSNIQLEFGHFAQGSRLVLAYNAILLPNLTFCYGSMLRKHGFMLELLFIFARL